jgi:hypothetical protein
MDKNFSRAEAERQNREQRNAKLRARDRYGVWLTEDIRRLRRALVPSYPETEIATRPIAFCVNIRSARRSKGSSTARLVAKRNSPTD